MEKVTGYKSNNLEKYKKVLFLSQNSTESKKEICKRTNTSYRAFCSWWKREKERQAKGKAPLIFDETYDKKKRKYTRSVKQAFSNNQDSDVIKFLESLISLLKKGN